MLKFLFSDKIKINKGACCMKKFKNYLICLLVSSFFSMPIVAIQLDTSIDDSIRKNYNPNKIEEDNALPAMPAIFKNENTQQQAKHAQSNPQNSPTKSQITYAVLKKGTKVSLKLLNNVSDRSKSGTVVSFVSLYPVSTTYFTIPMGTKFTGKVVSTHGPQFTGNGGLIAMKIDSMSINDEVQPIDAHVTRVNDKYIFFNNIKGQRKYGKSMLQATKPGRHFLTKMIRITGNLAVDGSSIVLTPFSIAAGVIGLGGNVLISPALALFYKGNPIRINSGSEVEIKFSQDVYIYN